MTRAADFPHNIPTDSLGLLAREPRAKTGEELRQETVYEVVREAIIALGLGDEHDAYGCLGRWLDRYGGDAARPIANAIHDALAVTREEKTAGERLIEAAEQAHEVASGDRAATVWVPELKPLADGGYSYARLASVGGDMVVASETLEWTTDNTSAQPPAQAPKVEEWMKGWASGARAYRSGHAQIYAAANLAGTPQGPEYWRPFWRAKTPYPDLPQEARDYIDLIASADGGE